MNSEDIDQELEAADSTALLAGILSELKQIRYELQLRNDIDDTDVNHIPQYECEKCGETVDEDNRENHLNREHNAPPNISVGGFFSAK